MKNFKRKLPLIAIAMLAITALIGGTFAYFSQSSSASNFLEANEYNSELTETFTPPQDGNFTPGVEVVKDVGVTNTGDVGMLVRIKYEESWTVDNITTPVSLIYGDAVDGWYDADPENDSFVAKKAGDPGANTNGNWVYGGDGYFYFTGELQPGDSTDSFIEAIMLKASSMDTVTSYAITIWDELLETYVLLDPATYADPAAAQTYLDDRDDGSYISSVVTNQTSTYDQLGLYELTFTVDTVQSVDAAATAWLTGPPAPSTLSVIDFLDNYQITP